MSNTNHRFYVYGLFYEDASNSDVCFYVGKETGRRCKRQLQESRLKRNNNPHKVRKIRKLRREGKEVFSEVLVDNLSEDKALHLEKLLLERETVFESVTNLRKGGRGGNSHSEKTCRKISEAHSGKNHPMWGKSHSEETKAKMSKSKSGENHFRYGNTIDEEHRRKIVRSNGKLGENEVAEIKWLIENSNMYQKDVADFYSVDKANITKIKKGKSWDYVELQKPDNVGAIESNYEYSKS